MMLKPETHPFPVKYRWRTIGVKMFPAYILFPIFLGLFIWAVSRDGMTSPVWGFLTISVITLGISIYGSWYHWNRAYSLYEVNDVTVRIEDPDYYVPPSLFAVFLEEIYAKFRPHIEPSPKRLLAGSNITLTKEMPRDSKVVGPKVGITYPGKKSTRVHAPHILNHGGAGYELRLIICHQLFPGRPEGEDIVWMKEKGII